MRCSKIKKHNATRIILCMTGNKRQLVSIYTYYTLYKVLNDTTHCFLHSCICDTHGHIIRLSLIVAEQNILQVLS
jgi:hypothetical protein